MKYKSLVVLAILLFTNSVFAADSKTDRAWIGGVGGMDRADDTSFVAFGGTAGVRFGHFGLGGYYITSLSKKVSGLDFKHSMYGAEPALFFGSERVIAHLGLRVGVSDASAAVTVRGLTFTANSADFMIGPTLGLDLKLGSVVSIGAEGGYGYVMANSSYSVITGFGALKFWF